MLSLPEGDHTTKGGFPFIALALQYNNKKNLDDLDCVRIGLAQLGLYAKTAKAISDMLSECLTRTTVCPSRTYRVVKG